MNASLARDTCMTCLNNAHGVVQNRNSVRWPEHEFWVIFHCHDLAQNYSISALSVTKAVKVPASAHCRIFRVRIRLSNIM